jgi:hypothetical protein
MPDWSAPDQRWRLLAPDGAAVVEVRGRGSAAVSAKGQANRLRALPRNAPVVLLAPGRGGRRRLRRVARRAGLAVDAEYVALPSLATPVALTQVRPGPLRWTARTVLTVPSGVTRLHQPAWLAIRLVRAVPRLLGVPAGGRVLVGRRL